MTRYWHTLRKVMLAVPACSLLVACGGGGGDNDGDSNDSPPTVSDPAEINFVIKVTDGDNEGFNDTTSATPVGGNTGTTLGAQRLGVIREAARLWSAVLDINTDIVLEVSFDELQCNSVQGVVGAASPLFVFHEFDGAPQNGIWYVSALANNLAKRDLDPSSDIAAEFNSRIGQAGCLNGTEFYYGFDGNNNNNQIDLLHIVLHEIGHGLGFISLIDVNTGALLEDGDGIAHMDAFTANLRDGNFTQFAQLTDSQRAQSTVSQALWGGGAVTAAMDTLNFGTVETPGGTGVAMYTPDQADGGSSLSHWDESLDPTELMQPSTPEKGRRQLSALDRGAMRDIGWPLREDSDQDGDYLPDVWELSNGLDPRIDDSADDLDGDGLTNAQELGFGTAANKADTDGDTLSDAAELDIHNTDPTKADTNGDGIRDNEKF